MKWKIRNIICELIIGYLILLLGGCASTNNKDKIAVLNVPPGLDSTTVKISNQIAEANFVSNHLEHRANQLTSSGKNELDKVDSFWKFLEQKVKKNQSLTKSEQILLDREIGLGLKYVEKLKQVENSEDLEKNMQRAKIYSRQAQLHLEEAVKLNPFDKNARMLLSVVYYNLQHIFGQKRNYEKSIEILERLIRIEKGEHGLFRLLADNYLAMNNYEKALQNFQKAQTVLIKTSFASLPDTSMMFYYMYAQGDIYARMYDAPKAMKAMKVAEKFARKESEKEDIANYLHWINWDGGNIRAVEIWDKIIELENSKKYEEVVTSCEKLYPVLKTEKARIQVYQKLAVIEFEILDKKAVAIERMRSLFESLNLADSSKYANEYMQVFLDSYGAMLYRMGVDALEKQDKKLALAYFNKATSFQWDKVARAYLELVNILWNDPEKAILFGEKAIESKNGLTTKEAKDLYSLMVQAHKSAGKYDEARQYFDKWKIMQE